MKIFKDFSENSRFNELVDVTSRSKDVQGLVLEVNPMWIYLWRLNEKFGSDWLNNRLKEWRRFGNGFFPFPYFYPIENYVLELSRYHLETDSWIPKSLFSLDKLKDFQDQIKQHLDFPETKEFFRLFIARVCLYPNSYQFESQFSTSEEDNFQIIYESRPISYLFNNSQKLHQPIKGGTSIGVSDNDFGTLGGFLIDDSTGRVYGLTCAHVVKDKLKIYHPAKFDFKKNIEIGFVIYKTVLKHLPYNFYESKNLDYANNVDVALIAITENPIDNNIVDLGSVGELFPEDNLVPNTSVEFVGRSSGHKQYLFADGDVKFYDFEFNNTKYRYKDLIQIRQFGKLQNLISTPTMFGDSGAWLCTNSKIGFAWCGVVIGGNSQTGFAISSEKILTTLLAESKLNLKILSYQHHLYRS